MQARKRQAKRAQSIEDWKDARVQKIARRQRRKTAKVKARQAGKTARTAAKQRGRTARAKARAARKDARTSTPAIETGFETVQFEDFDTGGAGAGFDTAAYGNGGGALTIMDEAWFWPAVAAVAAGVFFLTKKKGAK